MAVRTKYSHCLLVWLHSSVLPIASDYDISPVWKEKFDQNIPIRQEKNPAECWCRARWCSSDTRLCWDVVTWPPGCHVTHCSGMNFITSLNMCDAIEWYSLLVVVTRCGVQTAVSSQQRGSWQWQWGQKEAAAGTRMGASHRHAVTLSRGAAAGLCVNTKLLNNIFNISMPIWRSARGRVFN